MESLPPEYGEGVLQLECNDQIVSDLIFKTH